MAPNTEMPNPPPLPDPTLDLQSFPEILEWLIGSHYREWAVRTHHPSSNYEAGDRPSCALMAKVLLSVGDLPGSERRSPIETTYADALQQLRTRAARRLPEECVERAVMALHLGDGWRTLLEEKARAWDSGKASRSYRKDVVERAKGDPRVTERLALRAVWRRQRGVCRNPRNVWDRCLGPCGRGTHFAPQFGAAPAGRAGFDQPFRIRRCHQVFAPLSDPRARHRCLRGGDSRRRRYGLDRRSWWPIVFAWERECVADCSADRQCTRRGAEPACCGDAHLSP